MTNKELVGTCDWLVAELALSHLLDRARVQPIAEAFVSEQPYADARLLAEYLVEQGMLTQFQADKVLDGEARSLVMGPYVLAAPIGGSSTGTVYRGLGKADRLPCAIKVLPLRSLWNVRLARQQVRAFASLPPHAAVVPFLDVGTAQGRHYLVWPLVEGEPLDVLVGRAGPLAPAQVVRIALQLAEGLEVCHRHGIFHGILKPSNVSLAPDGAVRLLDFGIGALLAENTDESLLDTLSSASTAAAVLDCASPESILDPSRRLPASDQYSLGCVLYYILTGRYPFPDGPIVDKMMAYQSQTPVPIAELNPQVPPELAAIVARLMQKSPEARYRDLGEMIRELQPLAAGARPGFRPQSVQPDDTPRRGPLDETPSLLRPLAPPSANPPERPPISEPALRAPEPRLPLMRRLLGRLTFWRSPRDPLAVSVFAPASVPLGQASTLAVFAHAGPAVDVPALARTYFPGHEPIGAAPLRRPVVRGSLLTLHLALPGIAVDQPVQKFVWRGQTMPLPFAIRVPADCRPGEVVGILSVGEGGDIIMNTEFRVLIGKSD